MSKISDVTEVLDFDQKKRLNSLFNENFNDKEDMSPIKKQTYAPPAFVPTKNAIFEEDEDDLDESIMIEKKPSPPPPRPSTG
jgi:hypothetical protein